ncbi:PEP-CTERM sorting domain-containing protein [Muricoccus aerilatus]|uniref:PEP-CTERM sorting domain-containing protein n=1 Tax=Muricoccus aerilatus TaxID=452982 RepID=UPI0005C1E8EA|nr:PEP-CTERM sorting domain-containing protein [Roseomonas aerilata]
MSFRNVALAVGLALSVAATGPASADVIFNFVGTSYTPPGQPTEFVNRVNGQLVVTDAAYASGYTFSRTQLGTFANGPTIQQSDSTDGLVGVTFRFGPESASNADFGLQRNAIQYFGAIYQIAIDISAAANSFPVGSLYFKDLNFLVNYTLSGATGSGFGGILGMGNCTEPGCAFTTITTQAVPEPASMALFGAGLLGLAAVRRKRQV